MTTPTDLAQALRDDIRRCLDDVATEFRARGRDDTRFVRLIARMDSFAAREPRAQPASVPLKDWMCDRAKLTELAEHLESVGWRPGPTGDAECYDQGAAMAAEIVRVIIARRSFEAQPASVADGWREKFDELLEDYAGARAEVAVWNVTQSVQPPTGIRLPRSRLAKLLAHVDQITAAPRPARDAKRDRYMFIGGWRTAADWARRPDLISDIGSPAWEKELTAMAQESGDAT